MIAAAENFLYAEAAGYEPESTTGRVPLKEQRAGFGRT